MSGFVNSSVASDAAVTRWCVVKILFLDQFSELGGAQRGLLDLVPAIEERGWAAQAAIPGGGPLVEHFRSRGVAVIDIPCGPYQSGTKVAADVVRFGMDFRQQVRIVRDALDRERFDLLYVNGPRLLPAVSFVSPDRVPVLFHANSHIPEGLQMRVARRSLQRMRAAVVACSQSVASDYAGEVRVIFNGCRDLGFRVRKFDTWRIGVIGRISPEKGQLEFLEAASKLVPEFPSARFVICGAPLFSMPDYFDRVRDKARTLPAEFLGWREDIDTVLAGLDLLVVPSNREGMGRVVVEAFSAGVPVVAFPVGGIPEIVKDHETGFLTAQPTANALADGIRKIMTSDRDSLQAVAANARRAWESSYTLDRYRNQITDLIELVVSHWRARHGTAAPPLCR